ncbi:MAG: hypothetical protein AB1489_43250, partial [Acidobacteriota bacterium]
YCRMASISDKQIKVLGKGGFMDDLEVRRYQMLTRVRDFLAARPNAFSTDSLGGELTSTIRMVVDNLTNHAVAQSSGTSEARKGSISKAVARAALREDLQAIRRTARAIALDSPEVIEKFRIPRSNSDQLLLNTARAFLADATPLAQEFLRYEIPANFLDDLKQDIADFEQAINTFNAGTETQVSATAAIDDTMDKGINAVRKLDPIIRNKYRDDPALLSAWISASHTERASRIASTPKTPPSS